MVKQAQIIGADKRHTFKKFEQMPPQKVLPYCVFHHACGNNIICKATVLDYVPKFNRGVYLQNKTKIGTVDQIFGKIQQFYFSVVLEQGFKPSSFKQNQPLYLGSDDALPVVRFTNPPKNNPRGGMNSRGRGGSRGGSFRGRGGGNRGMRGGNGRGRGAGAGRGRGR